MSGFASPNYTDIPNEFLDHIMADLSEGALKVYLAMLRLRSLGTRVTDVEELACGTGVVEEDVLESAEELAGRGLITSTSVGNSGRQVYSLPLAREVTE